MNASSITDIDPVLQYSQEKHGPRGLTAVEKVFERFNADNIKTLMFVLMLLMKGNPDSFDRPYEGFSVLNRVRPGEASKWKSGYVDLTSHFTNRTSYDYMTNEDIKGEVLALITFAFQRGYTRFLRDFKLALLGNNYTEAIDIGIPDFKAPGVLNRMRLTVGLPPKASTQQGGRSRKSRKQRKQRKQQQRSRKTRSNRR
jgi:hypothetical protein